MHTEIDLLVARLPAGAVDGINLAVEAYREALVLDTACAYAKARARALTVEAARQARKHASFNVRCRVVPSETTY